ncbi:MAG: DNA polymerase III subunit chi [Alphaproteobacteria bacterium]|nr:DNA polymerase III subunit chi [Alphaproteobacteria bacterium]
MTEARFYHLQKQTLDQALPLILEKAYQTGKNIVLRVQDKKEAERLNTHLWTYRPDAFLPHGCAKEGNAEHQPIWLTEKDENPNDAKIIILTQGTSTESIEDWDLCCEMLDGHSNDQVTTARAKWKDYKDKGLEVTYWMQSDSGGWENKA